MHRYLAMLADCAERDQCTAGEAEYIVGKTRWMVGQHFMHIGAAALQPLAQRKDGGDPDDTWTAAMSESRAFLTNGYAGQPDSTKIVNVFHAALIALRTRWWGEWIPSKANIADIMTRPGRFHELLAGLEQGVNVHTYDFVLPRSIGRQPAS